MNWVNAVLFAFRIIGHRRSSFSDLCPTFASWKWPLKALNTSITILGTPYSSLCILALLQYLQRLLRLPLEFWNFLLNSMKDCLALCLLLNRFNEKSLLTFLIRFACVYLASIPNMTAAAVVKIAVHLSALIQVIKWLWLGVLSVTFFLLNIIKLTFSTATTKKAEWFQNNSFTSPFSIEYFSALLCFSSLAIYCDLLLI